MVQCFAADCNHRSDREKCKFFKIPEQNAVRRKWLFAARRDVMPTQSSRLCSCHFKNGNKNVIPSLFARNVHKKLNFKSPEKRTKQKRTNIKRNIALEEDDNIPSNNSVLVSNSDQPGPSTSSNSFAFNVENSGCAILEKCDGSSKHVMEESRENASICSRQTQTNIEFRSLETQTDHEFSPKFYEAQLYFKNQQIRELNEKMSKMEKQKFGVDYLKNDTDYVHYTGLSKSTFHAVCEAAKLTKFEYAGGFNVTRFTIEDQIFITLMKLRQNPSLYDMGNRFGCSTTTVANIIHTFIHLLHEMLYVSFVENNIPSRRKTQLSLPGCFETFLNCRIVIDCTEIGCEISSNMHQQRQTYSSYKHRNTCKILLAIAPNGTIVFCSSTYPGSISDKNITEHCGILKHLKPGDLILADKGFLISELLPTGVSLNVPPFKLREQFTAAEIQETNRIARARIHVERAICRMKLYKILNFVPVTFLPVSTKLVQLCATLVNLASPILKEVQSTFITNDEAMDLQDDFKLININSCM